MTDSTHIDHLLSDYLDGSLPPADQQAVDRHLATCATCRSERDALAAVRKAVGALPRSLPPPHDLWPAIQAQISDPLADDARARAERDTNSLADRQPVAPPSRRLRFRRWHAGVLSALILLLVAAYWLALPPFTPAWTVTRLEGTPHIDAVPLAETGDLRRGDWIETDDRSRAAVDVGVIGNVEVGPNTRLQMVEARASNHRLALAEGSIHARIWAPPRLFFVETPSALAIDLGCEYTLTVDSLGGSLLHVTSGYVELQHGERTAVVPAGAMCLTRPGLGPGTPFDEDASEAFRQALNRFDFEDRTPAALTALLREARELDAATLWRLMYTLDLNERGRLYDRLAELVPPPNGITRDAVLNADLDAIEAWDRHLGLDLDDGWFFRLFKKKKKQTP